MLSLLSYTLRYINVADLGIIFQVDTVDNIFNVFVYYNGESES